MTKKLLFCFALLTGLAFGWCAHAAIINTNGSAGAVQAAIKSAKAGDTVIIPNGTYHWSSTVTIKKFVILQGASIGGVTLIDDLPSGNLISVTASPNGDTTIANLIVVPGIINHATGGQAIYYGLVVDGGGLPVLLHDCAFYTTASGPYEYAIWWRTNGGVIWNCTFDSLGNYIGGIEFLHTSDDDWKNPSSMGMTDSGGNRNTYVEDCTFKTCWVAGSDLGNDSRTVFRHCTFKDSTIYSHGQDTDLWGVRHWEVYNCTFTFTNNGTGSETVNGTTYSWTYPLNQGVWFEVRGGTGTFFNNTLDVILYRTESVQLDVLSINRLSSFMPCQTSYPAPRQVGQTWIGAGGHSYPNYSADGTGYSTDPIYVWGNTGPAASQANFVYAHQDTPDACGNGQQIGTYVQQNRDYVFGVRPNYAPYPYPHPLRFARRLPAQPRRNWMKQVRPTTTGNPKNK
jgi:hypothetical protein